MPTDRSNRNPPESTRIAPCIGYATNLYPADCLPELLSTLGGPFRRISERAGGADPLALEVRLGERAAATLAADRAAREQLHATLAEAKLAMATVNAFSPSEFHARRVKEDAYRPTWLEPARRAYTLNVAELFAALREPGSDGSISTSPGSLKAFGHTAELVRAIAEAFAEAACDLAELEERSGVRILLAIEPEPGCTIESTDELIAFYEDSLLVHGARRAVERAGGTRRSAERLLRRHVGMTFDTAHLSILFEDLVESARRIVGAGIPIGKVHATGAIRVPRPLDEPDALAQLGRFIGSPYLHQCVGVDASGAVCLRTMDLAPLFERPDAMRGCAELRVHFHLPLFLDAATALGSTADEALRATRSLLDRHVCDTIILETYTWRLLELPPSCAAGGIEAAVAAEIRAARRAFCGDDAEPHPADG